MVGCLKDGFETLVGHTDMHLFKFLVVQYKISPTNPVWSPKDALPIRLWKVNPDGSPKLPMGMPSPIPYCSI